MSIFTCQQALTEDVHLIIETIKKFFNPFPFYHICSMVILVMRKEQKSVNNSLLMEVSELQRRIYKFLEA